jgi:hypothetical protein
MKPKFEKTPNSQRTVSGQAGFYLAWFAAVFVAIAVFSSIAQAATFQVTTTADNGNNTNPTAGSLREAIIKSNLTGGTDTITFNISGSGVHIFSLITALPIITDPVVIDGYTQPGAKANTLPNNDDAILLIEITGTNPFNFSVDDGLVITAGSTTVEGLIINGFKGTGNSMGAGIRLSSKGGNVIAGNFIGVDPNGTNQIPNGDGILILGCDNNVIGGSQTFSRNLISGNKLGVDIQQSGAYNNLIVGNFIGVNRSATGALANTGSGVQLNNVGTASSAGVIGGNVAGAGNVISGNGSDGIQVSGSCSSLKIQGNFIGTNVTGTAALGNTASGIYVNSTNSVPVMIGGPTATERNLVSGNKGNGIDLIAGDGTLVDGNYIGTDITGKTGLGNKGDGLVIVSNSHTIGGSTPADGNVISANGSAGIYITGGSQASFFDRNLIGVGVDKVTALGNGIDGIRLDNGSNNFFGDPAEPNTIAFNGGTGIWIRNGTGNLLSANSFTGNHSLGIDLSAVGGNSTGVDQNDPGDADAGANNLQNYPVLTRASILNNGLSFISGTLNSAANTKFHIELFANAAADSSGFGEGGAYIGGFDVTTDANGNASFQTGGWPNLVAGQFISATATDPARNTSEFSKCAVLALDSPGSLEFTNATFSVTENGGQATVSVNRTGGSFGTVTLQYATVAGGSATAGSDYTSVSGTLTWGDGDSSPKSFTIPIKDNSIKAPNKTVNLAVSSPTNGATLGSPATAVLTIVDDETFQPGTLAFTAATYSVNEGAGQATISVSRTGGSSGAVSVTYSTGDGTANVLADYTETIGTLTWGDGDSATKTFSVSIINDSLDESDETVLLGLGNPGGGATLGSPASAVLTIVDDDLPPKVSINDVSIAEGNSGTTDFTFTVSLAAASGQTVSVNYTTADNTAQAGSDYQAANAMLTFVPGETSKQITVAVNGDTQVESNETFVVNLYNLINCSVGKVTGVGTIVNDDSNSSSATIQFSQGNYSVQEDLGAFTITVTRSGDTSGTSSVDYQTGDGTATQKADFEYAAGTLTFAPGESSKTVQLLLNEDMYVEGNEDFTVTLTNPTGGTLGQPAIASITIIDDAPESVTSPIDDAQSFVYMHYHDFLNREPDAAGLQFWTNQITSCGTNASCIDAARTNVSAAFYLSTEFQQTGYLLYLMQKESYATAPNYAAFMRDLQEISRGVIVNSPGWQQKLADNQQQFADKWVNRPEFIVAFNAKTNTEFVNALYANAGVTATPSDKAALVSKLDSSSETRSAAVLEVASNAAFRQQEMNNAFVLMEYFGYLRRDPNAAPDSDLTGYNFWLNKLNQFGGNYIDAEMVRAFIISTEYRQRFGP